MNLTDGLTLSNSWDNVGFRYNFSLFLISTQIEDFKKDCIFGKLNNQLICNF